MSTRDLILDVALVLLNERGESSVTSVDLANEMNISPGNLYYHFKGKEQVVEELYAQFHARLIVALQEVTKQAKSAHGDAKVTLAGLVVISDICQQFSFISHDIRGLHERYVSLRTTLAKMLSLLKQTLVILVSQVTQKSGLQGAETQAKIVADNILYTLLHFGGYDGLLSNEQRSKSTVDEHLYMHFLPFIES